MTDFSVVFAAAADVVTDPSTLLVILAGTCMGLIFGSLPGLTATMGVALLIPITYNMEPVQAIGMMLGCYVGGIAGGAIPAILLNIPGTPDACVTTMDGHPLAMQGMGAKALGWAAFSSGIGTFFSWMILVLAAPLLASACIKFGSPEYCALAFFGLSIIIAVSGKSILKGLLAGLLGIGISFIGIDPIWGNMRFTFSNVNLLSGISLMPALIGFYSIPQILNGCLGQSVKVDGGRIRLRDFVPSPRQLWREKFTIIRSSVIGTVIGAIPATGGNIAAYIAYDQSKKWSKDPESFGKGNVRGVISAEAANNGVCGGAMIPLTTLGIPGDSVTAMLLGGLIIHGLQPGPLLFAENPGVVYGLFTTLLMATLFMVLLQMFGIRIFIRILSVPINFLSAMLVVLSLVGSYALNNNFFDVIVALVLGLVGFIMSKADFPMAPAVLGLVLGAKFESEFRRSLQVGGDDIRIFLEHPIAMALIAVAVGMMIFSVISHRRSQKKEAEREDALEKEGGLGVK
ncbi:tripartite tricarboxylate transporter permease [Bacilliculturomica massiliensis]|uniref:tripartite tricarboxylate transporter permease n=1 Tax=Bacilliculturomica massiliensis TaxID=1917867 RepID=UPI00103069A9|nr:tripartite tricarboxylate transporter permease [Bacilliculturomica massiliensis]